MTELKFKSATPKAKRIKPKEALPLLEYLYDKLSDSAKSYSCESHNDIRSLARAGCWGRLSDPSILTNQVKNALVVELARENIDEIIADGKQDELRKIACHFGTLRGRHLKMLIDSLTIAGMKEIVSQIAGYPFMERNPALEEHCREMVKEKRLIDLPTFGKVMCEAIALEGGPKAFFNTDGYKYVQLLYATYSPNYASRNHAIDEYIKACNGEDLLELEILELKDAVLHTPYPESAIRIIDKLLSAKLISIPEISQALEAIAIPMPLIKDRKCFLVMMDDEDKDAQKPQNSLLIWYYDCDKVRGKDDEVTKHLGSLVGKHNIDKHKVEDVIYDIIGQIENKEEGDLN